MTEFLCFSIVIVLFSFKSILIAKCFFEGGGGRGGVDVFLLLF